MSRCSSYWPFCHLHRLFGDLYYYGRKFNSRAQLCRMIREYIAYYNFSRIQRRLGVHTPMEVYAQCRAA
ncbi:MAG: IS3 family transposase [Oscillospiraceae bacterium]|nr:IS3 family transposase [Oscillospiraceae bacterium]